MILRTPKYTSWYSECERMSAELLNLGKYKPEACTHLNSLMHGTCSLFPSFTPVIIVPIPRFSSKVLDKTLKLLQTRVGNGLRNAVALVSIPTQGWVALGSVRNVAGKSPREHWEFIEHEHIRCADKSSWKRGIRFLESCLASPDYAV